MEKIPIYIINLKKDKKKKEYMKKLCTQYNVNVNFFDAIEGVCLRDSYVDKIYNKTLAIKYFGRGLTKGEIGTVLSHLALYKKIIEKNIEKILILEDDIECRLKDTELYDIVENMPKDCECLLLGAHPNYSSTVDGAGSFWKTIKINNRLKYIRYSEKVFGAYGYIITKAGAQKMLDFFSIIDRPIDHWHENRINLYGVSPSVIVPNRELLSMSSLSVQRKKLTKTAKRTFFQEYKDKIRLFFQYMKILHMILKLKSWLTRFKLPKKYM